MRPDIKVGQRGALSSSGTPVGEEGAAGGKSGFVGQGKAFEQRRTQKMIEVLAPRKMRRELCEENGIDDNPLGLGAPELV